jgi:hypothetical protein
MSPVAEDTIVSRAQAEPAGSTADDGRHADARSGERGDWAGWATVSHAPQVAAMMELRWGKV